MDKKAKGDRIFREADILKYPLTLPVEGDYQPSGQGDYQPARQVTLMEDTITITQVTMPENTASDQTAQNAQGASGATAHA